MNICTPDVDSLVSPYSDIERYYTQKVLTYGATAHGVDWGCTPTQELRFVQLLKLCNFNASFSLNDFGCGYGALLGYLRRRHRRTIIDYLGVDISPAMIMEAQRIWYRYQRSTFILANTLPRTADYTVASGIFNVQLGQPLDIWIAFIKRTLKHLHKTSHRGFAVNFLASTSTEAPLGEDLYRSPPEYWLTYCKDNFNLNGKLIDDYGMNEFTLLFIT